MHITIMTERRGNELNAIVSIPIGQVGMRNHGYFYKIGNNFTIDLAIHTIKLDFSLQVLGFALVIGFIMVAIYKVQCPVGFSLPRSML